MQEIPGIGDTYTLSEVAAQLGVSEPTVKNWIKRGCRGRKLAAHRIGNRFAISPEQIQEFTSPPTESPSPYTKSKPLPSSLESLRRRGFKV